MRITESRLRQIVRHQIAESFDSAGYIATRVEPDWRKDSPDAGVAFGYIVDEIADPKHAPISLLGGFIADMLGFKEGDLQEILEVGGNDAVWDSMMNRYKRKIASLPDDAPKRAQFEDAVDRIMKTIKILGI